MLGVSTTNKCKRKYAMNFNSGTGIIREYLTSMDAYGVLRKKKPKFKRAFSLYISRQSYTLAFDCLLPLFLIKILFII